MNKQILVLAAHPDDEALGCGGTIARLVDEGYDATVMFMTDGVGARKLKYLEKSKRKSAAKKACKIIGFKKIYFNNFPDNQLDSVPLLKIIKKIENLLHKISPTLIFTHHQDDINIDHNIVSQATFTASRFYRPKNLKIFAYEVLSSSNINFGKKNYLFEPNTFINIEKTINRKIKALKMYKDELRDFPHPRSIEGVKILAKFRGMHSSNNFAEAFDLKKNII